jgi:hypothetical protein
VTAARRKPKPQTVEAGSAELHRCGICRRFHAAGRCRYVAQPKHRKRSTTKPTPTAEPMMTAVDQVFESLVEAHRLETAHHRALAWRIANALTEGGANNLSEAIRGMSLLPVATVRTKAERSISASAVRQRLTELIENNRVAYRTELGERVRRGDALSKVEFHALQMLVAEAEEAGVEVERLEAQQPAVSAPNAAVAAMAVPGEAATPKVITPTDIQPPCERGVPRPNYADDAKAAARRTAPVIDNPPQPQPPPDGTKPGQWDCTEDAAKWRAWRERYGDIDYLL